MTISAALVKELRERTGAGMMECKNALVNANGDIEKAIDDMRKAGQAKADKKQDRTAAEGIIVIKLTDNAKLAVILEVNSETDFVARHENFTKFANDAAQTALNDQIADITTLMNTTLSNGETIDHARRTLVTNMGENIQVRRLILIKATGELGSYIHSGRIGVVVDITGGTPALAKDLAMHIAANKPLVVKPSQVSSELIAKEKEIFTAQALESGKPAEIVEKMIAGRIDKFLDEISLLGQAFVKDPNMKIQQLLKNANADVASFVRLEVGEGIEKKESNFVEEVMAQVRTAE